MKYLVALSTCLIFASAAWAQSKSIAQFQKDHTTAQALYFYPSTLRMINLEKNPDYYQLVKHVEKLQFLAFDKKEQSLNASRIQQLLQALQQENYTTLFSLHNKDNHIQIYALGETPVPEEMVAVVNNPESLYLVTMEGFVDMSSLLKLMKSDFDFGKVADIMKTTADKEGDHRKNDNAN